MNVKFELCVDDLRKKIPTLTQDFDAIFHDAFSFKMPDSGQWISFREYYRLLKNRQGRLLTYSSAGAVRGGLMEAGFQVGKTQGLGTKASSTMAFIPVVADECPLNKIASRKISDDSHIFQLDERERDYIASRAGLPYRDPDFSQSRADIIQVRQQEQKTSLRLSGKKKSEFLKSIGTSE